MVAFRFSDACFSQILSILSEEAVKMTTNKLTLSYTGYFWKQLANSFEWFQKTEDFDKPFDENRTNDSYSKLSQKMPPKLNVDRINEKYKILELHLVKV